MRRCGKGCRVAVQAASLHFRRYNTQRSSALLGLMEPSVDNILQDPITGILRDLNISTWDALLVGDGAGSRHNNPCGWASILVDRETADRRVPNTDSQTFATCARQSVYPEIQHTRTAITDNFQVQKGITAL